MAVCKFCGHSGIIGKDIVNEDFFDRITRRDTTVEGCRDKNACMIRQDKVWQEYLKVRKGVQSGVQTE